MIPSARITNEILALTFIACLWLQAVPDESAARQKCPIAIPDSVILPATLQVQKWDPTGRGQGQQSGIPTVVVSFNNSRLEHAAIATGLNANAVSPAAALRLKLSPIDGKVTVNAMDATAGASQAEISQFHASTLELPKIPVAVTDVPGMLSLKSHPDAPTAWLGMPFLSAFQITLDPVSNSVTLQKAATKLPRPRQTSVVPLVLRDNRPYVSVSIPGAKPFLALLDTASPGSVIPTVVAEKLKIKPLKPVVEITRQGKPGKAAEIILPKLSVGKAEWKMPHVIYLTSDSSKEFDRTFAVIGMDFIGQFKVTIDFLHSQVALSPPEKPAVKPKGETP